jgi:hypothetical protein
VNLEELVRAALAEEAKAEPGEAGAYERFLGHRRRGALAVAAFTGLAVALVLALAVGGALVVRGEGGDQGQVAGPAAPATTSTVTPTTARAPGGGPVQTTLPAPPPVPVSPTGVVRREHQGFELTLPKAWVVDQSTTRSYHQFGQPWLVLSPGGRVITANDQRRMTIFTAVHEPRVYPGRATGDPRPLLPGQSFGSLSGHRSSGRRADGRAFAVGDQGAMLQYAIAWPYRCAAGLPCPEAARWRVLQIDIEGTGGQEGLKVRRVARQLVESIRPITNALAPAGASVPEEPSLFADAPVVVGRGGKGVYAWEKLVRKGSGQEYWTELRHQDGGLMYGGSYQAPGRSEQQAMIHCLPSQKRATAMLVEGYGSEAVSKVVLELKGRVPVEVATFRNPEFPFTFWVVAPLPPDARPLSFTSFDAAGQQIAKDTSFSGYVKCNP